MSDTLSVLLEHEDFLVVNKPVGVPMHDKDSGIVQQVHAQTGIANLHLVHRLDTPTSGCLILATNKKAAATLSRMFSYHQIDKYYIALLANKPKKKQGSVIGDMINRRSGQRALTHSKDNPAVTQFLSESIEPGLRLALVKPITGKTHQIRVAMKSLGSPIIGDDRYGGAAADRLYLHAWHLRFEYANETITCYAKPLAGDLFSLQSFDTWLERAPAPETLKWPGNQVSSESK
ncbi:TIGR01621 family pseudouridine synthase [Alteromonas sediminis]|uniref:TIGR01621 family pseudouridine synthase n=1 Tax=Alteromonas sediminis TaxID=2259342 RepID=A0A3N5ZB03_9ALTE|nr:TIGR01621 family pseudouridine synthase [Alteromonas sediminis]RPJ68394.1 TIGR01621 family pseudouridine synthase [Alteromonas sediminis]